MTPHLIIMPGGRREREGHEIFLPTSPPAWRSFFLLFVCFSHTSNCAFSHQKDNPTIICLLSLSCGVGWGGGEEEGCKYKQKGPTAGGGKVQDKHRRLPSFKARDFPDISVPGDLELYRSTSTISLHLYA